MIVPECNQGDLNSFYCNVAEHSAWYLKKLFSGRKWVKITEFKLVIIILDIATAIQHITLFFVCFFFFFFPFSSHWFFIYIFYLKYLYLLFFPFVFLQSSFQFYQLIPNTTSIYLHHLSISSLTNRYSFLILSLVCHCLILHLLIIKMAFSEQLQLLYISDISLPPYSLFCSFPLFVFWSHQSSSHLLSSPSFTLSSPLLPHSLFSFPCLSCFFRADPGFSNRGGAKDYARIHITMYHTARRPVRPVSRARFTALEAC